MNDERGEMRGDNREIKIDNKRGLENEKKREEKRVGKGIN
jgi:hypothetical protein